MVEAFFFYIYKIEKYILQYFGYFYLKNSDINCEIHIAANKSLIQFDICSFRMYLVF